MPSLIKSPSLPRARGCHSPGLTLLVLATPAGTRSPDTLAMTSFCGVTPSPWGGQQRSLCWPQRLPPAPDLSRCQPPATARERGRGLQAGVPPQPATGPGTLPCVLLQHHTHPGGCRGPRRAALLGHRPPVLGWGLGISLGGGAWGPRTGLCSGAWALVPPVWSSLGTRLILSPSRLGSSLAMLGPGAGALATQAPGLGPPPPLTLRAALRAGPPPALTLGTPGSWTTCPWLNWGHLLPCRHGKLVCDSPSVMWLCGCQGHPH